MAFIRDAEAVARAAMAEINPELADRFGTVVRFLAYDPSAASSLRGRNAPEIGTREYIRRQAISFADARNPRAPQAPATVPDELVSVILTEYFGIAKCDVERVKREHALSMGAENLVGDLLERYLASELEPREWIWCSGAMVKAADFLYPPRAAGKPWRLLQVKNRDNSENSSSSKVRDGTAIEKWHRTFSRREGSNWTKFPDASLRMHLSENAFKEFVKQYLRAL